MEGTSNERIVKTPGTCGGRARIAGHRVRVQDIVIWHEHQGMTPDSTAMLDRLEGGEFLMTLTIMRSCSLKSNGCSGRSTPFSYTAST